MNRYRKTAIIVGVLILIGYPTSILGGAMIDGILNAPDYLTNVSVSQSQVVIGVLLELINGIAVVGIAVMMFPLLKKQDEALALGYVAARTIEAVVIIAGVGSALSLLALGQEYAKVGAPDAAYLQASGASLLAARALWVGQMLAISFSLAALLFYTLLYQSKLVPRFISVWGFIAAALVLTWHVLDMFGLGFDMAVNMVFVLPMMLNEIFLAIWLIAKGFNSSTIASELAE